jgi:chaperonin GroEL (HSP60 family)
MQFGGGYVTPYFITNAEEKIAELDHPYILIHEKKLSDFRSISPLVEKIVMVGRPLLIVAEDVDGQALPFLVTNKREGKLKVAAVRVASAGRNREATMWDIATLTGGLVFNDALGINVENASLDQLGTARKVVIEKETTTILGGGGKNIESMAKWTVAEETNLKDWLVSQMSAASRAPQSKADMKRLATAAGLKFSARAFVRTWRAAVLESGAGAWSRPGKRR